MRAAAQANRWLSLRLELLGITIVVATAALASLFLRGNPGLAGLALTSALNLTGFLNWFVRTSSELEVTALLPCSLDCCCRHCTASLCAIRCGLNDTYAWGGCRAQAWVGQHDLCSLVQHSCPASQAVLSLPVKVLSM